MSLATAEDLADRVLRGDYEPSDAADCTTDFTADQNPQTVRLAEFTLFAEPSPRVVGVPRYLIAQPWIIRRVSAAERRRYLDREVRPFVNRVLQSLPTSQLPRPTTRRIEIIRDALREVLAESTDELHRTRQIDRSALFDVKDVPRIDLPDDALRRAYKSWLDQEGRRMLRARVGTLAAKMLPGIGGPDESIEIDDLVGRFGEAEYPTAYQPYASPFAHIGICAVFEQEWRLAGYTRGELIDSLSLAPGERLTLEVHSWDKTSRKSEEEIATESEVRTSEKLTQRDALTVTQEYAKRGTQASASMRRFRFRRCRSPLEPVPRRRRPRAFDGRRRTSVKERKRPQLRSA